LTVKKMVKGGQTETSVRVVSGVEKIEELAEMIGGQKVSEVSRAQAEEMLEGARANGKARRRVTAR
jgi:DNA repair protein RecN (Recombination protein N)